jgi:hypothetical protein
MSSKIPFRLILLPENPDFTPDKTEPVTEALRAISFLGPAIGGSDNRFTIGERFFDHISFLGCSPSIKIEPENENDRHFCHIRISQFSSAHFYHGQLTKLPSCSNCKKPLSSLKKKLEDQETAGFEGRWHCEQCDAAGDIKALNWRKTAGYGSFSIEIWSVYPNEAVPSDFLLGTVEKVTSQKWRYIYV